MNRGTAAMTPRGSSTYLLGLLILFGGLGVLALVMLILFVQDMRAHGETVVVLLLSGLLLMIAGHVLAAGLYRMLVHLYSAISRTEPAGDRPLRGTRIF